MKKLLIVAVMALVAVAGYGQGEVNFANASSSLITTNNGPGTPMFNMAGAGNYRIGLYVGAVGSQSSSFTLAGSGLNSALGGRFNANPATGFFALPGGFPSGTQIAFQVRAWSAAHGATYAAALANPAAWLGESALGRTTPGGGTVLPGAIFGPSSPTGDSGVGGFNLTNAIPEPSSIALGLLGLGAIALFRRRK